MTFRIKKLNIKGLFVTVSVMTFSIKTFRTMTLSIRGLFVTVSMNDIQNNDIQN